MTTPSWSGSVFAAALAAPHAVAEAAEAGDPPQHVYALPRVSPAAFTFPAVATLRLCAPRTRRSARLQPCCCSAAAVRVAAVQLAGCRRHTAAARGPTAAHGNVRQARSSRCAGNSVWTSCPRAGKAVRGGGAPVAAAAAAAAAAVAGVPGGDGVGRFETSHPGRAATRSATRPATQPTQTRRENCVACLRASAADARRASSAQCVRGTQRKVRRGSVENPANAPQVCART
jgi:hypothetical protein